MGRVSSLVCLRQEGGRGKEGLPQPFHHGEGQLSLQLEGLGVGWKAFSHNHTTEEEDSTSYVPITPLGLAQP